MKLGSLFVLFAAVCTLLGCSEKPEVSLSQIKSKDLGVVNLSYGSPSKQDIGSGFICVLTPNPMNATSCEILIKIEKSGKVINSQRIIPAELDKRALITFENAEITFTPHIQ